MAINVKAHSRFPEIYWVTLEDGSHKLGTKNFAPGNAVYGERLVKFEGNEYRLWDPYRSKLGTALVKRLRTFPFNDNSSVLYLGAGNGTTASHISDICPNGQIYCIEFSPRAVDFFSWD